LFGLSEQAVWTPPRRCWKPPHSGSCCKKNFRARCQARRGRAFEGRHGPFGRACLIVGADRKMVRFHPAIRRTRSFAEGCVSLPMGDKRFGYRRLFILLRREASRQGSTAYTGSIRRTCGPQATRPAARRLASGCRSSWKRGRTRAGRSTLFVTSSPTDGVSTSSTSSTMLPRNAWARSRHLDLRSAGGGNRRTALQAGLDYLR
jgi:hypothetical protein